MQLSDWGPLLGALESLIMRCAALESILESDEPLLHQTQLADTLGESPTLPACTHACQRASVGRPCILTRLLTLPPPSGTLAELFSSACESHEEVANVGSTSARRHRRAVA